MKFRHAFVFVHRVADRSFSFIISLLTIRTQFLQRNGIFTASRVPQRGFYFTTKSDANDLLRKIFSAFFSFFSVPAEFRMRNTMQKNGAIYRILMLFCGNRV
ncbi:hypothetical protein [Pseudenterobacter timonensis]|uniref:hypothetical protein n=1 Tax=Pseudenterobacter timonensis TaxID=1755099 RepID=UPI002877E69F|nr:hypothetical protein [Pseudenterobacter timonensis]